MKKCLIALAILVAICFSSIVFADSNFDLSGNWTISRIAASGMSVDASDFGISMFIQLNSDHTYVFDMENIKYEGKWEYSENGIEIDFVGQSMNLPITQDGELRFEYEEDTYYGFRNAENPPIIGTWYLTTIRNDSVTQSASKAGITGMLTIGFGGKLTYKYNNASEETTWSWSEFGKTFNAETTDGSLAFTVSSPGELECAIADDVQVYTRTMPIAVPDSFSTLESAEESTEETESSISLASEELGNAPTSDGSESEATTMDYSEYSIEFDWKKLFRRPHNHIGKKYIIEGSIESLNYAEKNSNGGYKGIWLGLDEYVRNQYIILDIDALDFNLFEDDWLQVYVTITSVGPLSKYHDDEVFYAHVDAFNLFDQKDGTVIESYVQSDSFGSAPTLDTPTCNKRPDEFSDGFDYVAAYREPENYISQKYYVTGEVIQVLGNKNDGFNLRVALNSDRDQIVYIVGTCDKNILEGDTVAVYGEFDGNYSYDSWATTITVPKLTGEIEIIE